MTSKERMLCALKKEKPDRLPVTIHQWQGYHLETYMNGMSTLEAFKHCGLDQFNVLSTDSPEAIGREVRRLFEGFGKDGGYILSCSDHFFETPVENLKRYAQAAVKCVY